MGESNEFVTCGICAFVLVCDSVFSLKFVHCQNVLTARYTMQYEMFLDV